MFNTRIRDVLFSLFYCLLCCYSGFSVASETPSVKKPTSVPHVKSDVLPYQETAVIANFFPTQALQASWVFSGVVSNEDGETYGYFFQMQRDGEQFHSIAALFNAENNHVVLLDESNAQITNPMSYKWHVGQAFLRFNPINESWVFGLKTADNKGFNFKVDLLQEAENIPMTQDLRPGVELIVTQTGRLNGHIQTEQNKEQFVTAKNAWFRQLWLNGQQASTHTFTGVLCRFDDGSGFYSANMVAVDAFRGALAGWNTAQGLPSVVSQFISVKQDAKGLGISISLLLITI